MTSVLCVLVAQTVVGVAVTTPSQPVETTVRQPMTVLPWRHRSDAPERPDLPFPIRDPAEIRRLDRFAPHEVRIESSHGSSRERQFETISNGPAHQSILVESRSGAGLSFERPAQVPITKYRRDHAVPHRMDSPAVAGERCTQCGRSYGQLFDSPRTKTNCGCPR